MKISGKNANILIYWKNENQLKSIIWRTFTYSETICARPKYVSILKQNIKFAPWNTMNRHNRHLYSIEYLRSMCQLKSLSKMSIYPAIGKKRMFPTMYLIDLEVFWYLFWTSFYMFEHFEVKNTIRNLLSDKYTYSTGSRVFFWKVWFRPTIHKKSGIPCS